MNTKLGLLLGLLVIIILILSQNKENLININDFEYYDENNNKVDHINLEADEQIMAIRHLEPNDNILELGARYGSVSVIASKIVDGNGKLVAVEPDENVLHALENNKRINNANFDILNKVISNKNKSKIENGYSTHYIDSNETSDHTISYDEFKKLHPHKFNVLIADCEGCLGEFIETIGDDLDNYNKILFEADQPHMCNYDEIIDKLKSKGFKVKEHAFKDVDRYCLVKE